MLEYPQQTNLEDEYILKKLSEYWNEDFPDGDITSISTVSKNIVIEAEIQAVESLIFSGKMIIPHCFGEKCEVEIHVEDGDYIENGEVIGIVKGPALIILSRERVMLNLIQRLCGISSLTKEYTKKAAPYEVKILDTRKTTPGNRLFEKYAVSIGGGYNHRLNLSEGILIKDNHIAAAGSITNAIQSINNINLDFPIEVEVDNIEQIKEALLLQVDGFLLDNMDINTIKKSVSIIRQNQRGKNIFIEASGGITINNITPYLSTGINAISIGALTHQAVSKDIRLEFLNNIF